MTGSLKIICFLFDPNVGGPTIRARAVYEQMRKDGYDVRIAMPFGEGTAEPYLAEKEIPVDRLPIAKPVLPRKIAAFMKFVFTVPFSLFRLTRYLRAQKPDVIHVNGAFDMLPALAGRLANVPVVWHLNDTVFSRKFSRILGRLVAWIAHVTVIAATRVGEHYGVMDAQPHVIFAPVNVYQFRNPRSSDRATPMITLTGNWNWIKGQDRFVEVIARLYHAGHHIRAQIVGKFLDSQEAYWKPIVAKIRSDGLEKIIETPGFANDMVKVLEDSDILLLTSHSEASPISLLEAMSMGVPAVCFDVGGVAEMLGSDTNRPAGIVVPEGDTDAMVAAIEQILKDDSLCRKLSVAGRERAVSHFSLETCIEQHIIAYSAAQNARK